MPIPLLPLLFGAGGAVGGLFGGKNRTTQEQTSRGTQTSKGTRTSTGTRGTIFDSLTTEGFAPEFAGVANETLLDLFSTFGDVSLDPEQLNRQELAQKAKVNELASRLFDSTRGQQFARGQTFSPSGSGLARGLAEAFRGSELLDITGDFARQRFQLPGLQESLNASQRGGLLNIFRSLPRSQQRTGSEESTFDSTDIFNNTATSENFSTGTTVGRQGNPITNAIAGGIAGFGTGINFNNNRATSAGSGTNAFFFPTRATQSIYNPPPFPMPM